MEKTWMPTVAGILDIVCAAFHLLAVLGLTIAIVATGGVPFCAGVWVPGNVTAILLSIAIPFAIATILALVGGISALQRKNWGLALTGSIAAFFPVGLLGIAAIILTVLSKNEFE